MNPLSQKSDPSRRREIAVELLAIDLSTCTRCVGTLQNIETAIKILKQTLEATGTEVRFRKILIDSEAKAREHRFVSSPTIRINGQDLVFDTLESPCDSCTDLCGCPESTQCRVWQYRGQEFTEAPIGLIVEGLMNHISAAARPAAARPYAGVPENLRRFFASRVQPSAAASTCCPANEQEECCEAKEKVSCCGTATATACGCR